MPLNLLIDKKCLNQAVLLSENFTHEDIRQAVVKAVMIEFDLDLQKYELIQSLLLEKVSLIIIIEKNFAESNILGKIHQIELSKRIYQTNFNMISNYYK